MRRLFTTTIVVLVGGAVVVALWVASGDHPLADRPAPAPPSDAPLIEVPARPADAIPLTVERVVDGDTLRAHAWEAGALIPTTESQRVRLIGIDTPEVSGELECGGPEATDALRALAPEGSTVWVTTDVDPRDRYDRWLFYAWTDDGRFLNHELVASGAAEVLDIAPNSAHADLFAAAEAEARRAGAGQWGMC